MNTIKLNTLGDKVIVRKAAENGGNAGGGSNIEYLDVSEAFGNATNPNIVQITAAATEIKTLVNGNIIVLPIYAIQAFGDLTEMSRQATQIRVDWSMKICFPGGEPISIKEYVNVAGVTQEELNALPRITEEQFYNTAV